VTTLSTRYVSPLLALSLPALVSVAVYSGGALRSDDCADPSALSQTAWIEGLESLKEPEAGHGHALLQDTRGIIATEDPEISPLQFRIVRSFESERLHGNPFKFFSRAYAHVTSQPRLKWIGAPDDEVPIYEFVAEGPAIVRIGAYMFIYESRPVASPALTLLSGTFERIASGRRPMTLVTVSVLSPTPLRNDAERLAEKWLISAWKHERSVCSASSRFRADSGRTLDPRLRPW